MSATAPLPRVSNPALLADALAGLTSTPKTLPCKWLYDEEGARLFEAITRLPEYYPTRTEKHILREAAPEIAAATGRGAAVVEFGSGDGSKVSLLLDAMRAPAAYVPVDIAAEWLQGAAARVQAAHASIWVTPVVADFTAAFPLPAGLPPGPRLGFFPGSTIGTFTPEEAVGFLRRAHAVLGEGAKLVLGADLVKPRALLEAAYDDASGVTAAFNLNLLHRLNREAAGGFDLDAFRHEARWNAAKERVEMHLVSRREQVATLAGHALRFAEGESIHTENSHKYRPTSLRALAEAGGWQAARMWTDAERLFSLWLLEG
jgi:dimethylhistidine N-methyltransferase